MNFEEPFHLMEESILDKFHLVLLTLPVWAVCHISTYLIILSFALPFLFPQTKKILNWKRELEIDKCCECLEKKTQPILDKVIIGFIYFKDDGVDVTIKDRLNQFMDDVECSKEYVDTLSFVIKPPKSFESNTRIRQLTSAIDTLAKQGVNIIAVLEPIPIPYTSKNSFEFEQYMIDYLNEMGIIIISAAGDNNSEVSQYFPNNMNNILICTYINRDLKRNTSNYSLDNSKFLITSTGGFLTENDNVTDDEYTTINSAILVSIFAGIIQFCQRDLTSNKLFNILEESGRKVDTMPGEKIGKLIQPLPIIKNSCQVCPVY